MLPPGIITPLARQFVPKVARVGRSPDSPRQQTVPPGVTTGFGSTAPREQLVTKESAN